MSKIIDNYHQLWAILKKEEGFVLLPNTSHDEFQSLLKAPYKKVTYTTGDGIPLVIIRKLMGYTAERLYGPEMMRKITRKYSQKKHLFLASKTSSKEVISKLSLKKAKAIELGFEKNGSDLVTPELIKKVQAYRPDFIWIGIGSPKQVELAVALGSNGVKTKIFCVGAAFDFISQKKPQAPTWMQKYGFEWFFRLSQEPLRLGLRYLVLSPIGLLSFAFRQDSLLRKYWPYIIAILLSLAIVIPRLLASGMYDPLEDELLAISNNQRYSLFAQISAPDFSHPWLWYILMELPTKIFQTNYGIFFYRLIQIVLLAAFAMAGYAIVYKKKWFSFVFFSLLCLNPILVHITFQHRMYALVIGISIVYSLLWHTLIQSGKKIPIKKIVGLAGLALAGIFTSYSFIWIVLVWPIAYIYSQQSIDSLKKTVIFLATIGLGFSWFIPTFISNSLNSIANNQWAPAFSTTNILKVMGNYVGIFSVNESSSSEFVTATFLLCMILVAARMIYFKKNREIAGILIGLIVGFLVYLFVAFYTKNSLLYVRVSLPISICLYVFISKIAESRIKLAQLFIFLCLLVHIFYFYQYFYRAVDSPNYYFNYRKNPLRVVSELNLTAKDCMVVFPFWNQDLVDFFENRAKVISIFSENKDELIEKTKNCENTYAVVQVSVKKEVYFSQFELLEQLSADVILYASFENQEVFRVTNKY